MMGMPLKIFHYPLVGNRDENDAILQIRASTPIVDLLLFEEELYSQLQLLLS